MFKLSNPDRIKAAFKSKSAPFFVQDVINASGYPCRTIKAYNGTGGALTAGAPYLLKYDGDEETNPRVAVVTSGDVYGKHHVVFAAAATPDATFGDFVFEGHASIMVSGAAIAKDDFLKLYVGNTAALMEDGTTRTDSSIAIATEAGTGANSLKACWVIGEPVVIQPHCLHVTAASGVGLYPGQTRIQFDVSGNAREEIVLYTGDAGAMVAGGPYVVTYDGDQEKCPKALLAPGAVASGITEVVFATSNHAAAGYDWFVRKGFYTCMVNGAGIAKDDFLKYTAGDTSALLEDGTALSDASCAIACEAGTGSDTRKLCYVLGVRVVIPA